MVSILYSISTSVLCFFCSPVHQQVVTYQHSTTSSTSKVWVEFQFDAVCLFTHSHTRVLLHHNDLSTSLWTLFNHVTSFSHIKPTNIIMKTKKNNMASVRHKLWHHTNVRCAFHLVSLPALFHSWSCSCGCSLPNSCLRFRSREMNLRAEWGRTSHWQCFFFCFFLKSSQSIWYLAWLWAVQRFSTNMTVHASTQYYHPQL